jgi:histidinol-phosphatase (PHP family)
VLGSVHFIEDWAFDDPALVNRYGGWEIDALWDRYFSELAAAARSGLFDVMAHPDLVKKFGHRPAGSLTHWYEGAAAAFQEAGCAIELSTGGLRKPVGETYPSLEFLQICHRRGIPATMGSDAHAPHEVGHRFDEGRELLRAAGYESLVVFRERVAEEVAL